MTDDDVRSAIEKAFEAGARTPAEITKFVSERLAPMILIDVREPTQRDRDERRLSVSINSA